MAVIDLLNVTPHKVSRDLCGYTILFYGDPKTGKTTIASKFPNTLLLAFEIGYLTIPGVNALPINTWGEFKQAISQLKKPEVKDKFSNICIDTVDIAYDLCEKYICNNNGVDTIGAMPYGQGYALVRHEFDECLRQIPQLGYGLIMISHAEDKTFTDENGNEYNKIVSTLGKTPRLIVNRMSDIIGYARGIEQEDGTKETRLFMRQTPRFEAGSRFKYTPSSIIFTYDNLVKAIGDAIDQEANETNNDFVTDNRTSAYNIDKGPNFEDNLTEFKNLVDKIQKNVPAEQFKAKWAPFITSITEKYLGKGHKVNDCTIEQNDQLQLILIDLKNEVGQGL